MRRECRKWIVAQVRSLVPPQRELRLSALHWVRIEGDPPPVCPRERIRQKYSAREQPAGRAEFPRESEGTPVAVLFVFPGTAFSVSTEVSVTTKRREICKVLH